MRFKPVPAPPEHVRPLDALREVRGTLPAVPRSDDDCCTRIVRRVAWIEDPGSARTWLCFLRALGLAARTDAGYARSRQDADRDALARRFEERVFGVQEVREALTGRTDRSGTAGADAESATGIDRDGTYSDTDAPGDTDTPSDSGAPIGANAPGGPADPDAVFEWIRTDVPAWERHRVADWTADWRTRTEHLLAWATCLGLLEERPEGYVVR